MIHPPDPAVPALLLTVAAKLAFRVTSRDPQGNPLGVLTDTTGDHPLVLAAGDSPGVVVWALLPGGTSTPPISWLLTSPAADVLRGGQPCPDGSVLYQAAPNRLPGAL